jgi:Fe-S oxidoreductase
MAGNFGHEAEKRATSEQIYGMSWARHVGEWAQSGRLLAAGYSCRLQVKIMDGQPLLHPAQALLARLRGG